MASNETIGKHLRESEAYVYYFVKNCLLLLFLSGLLLLGFFLLFYKNISCTIHSYKYKLISLSIRFGISVKCSNAIYSNKKNFILI